MDYKKKYKEALPYIRNLIEHNIISIESAGKYFPELKENEDEKIRKGLIENFKWFCGDYPETTKWGKDDDLLVKDIIAWLEKQWGKDKLIRELGEYKVKYTQEVLKKRIDNMNNKDDERLRNTTIAFLKDFADKGYENAIECIDWLKKQGEQKPQGKTALEAINEEKVDNQFCVKSANKVESKFKSGDWIVRELDNSVHQVKNTLESVSNGKYAYDLTDGGYISTSHDSDYHLWTILDAKAGDILYTPKGLGVEGIFLVSGWQQIEGAGKTLCSNIGYRVDDDEIVEGGLGAIWWKGVKDPFFPATKEQRDLLFQKMKESGYEWDAAKKELKKIVAPKFKIGDTMRTLQEASNGITSGLPVIVSIDNEYYHCNNELIAIKNQDDYEYPPMNRRQNTAWSEEDENIKEWIMSDINKLLALNRKSFVIADKEIIWLKSLKDRYTWEPSDEQMEILSKEVTAWKKGCSKQIVLESLYNDLKKLK